MRFCHVIGDVGAERGLAHAGTAGDDDQIGGLQSAHLDVEIAQARCNARQLAVALERFCCHIDGDGEGLRKTLESAVVAAGLGQLIQPALASSICARGAKSTGASKATLTMSSPIRIRSRRSASS